MDEAKKTRNAGAVSTLSPARIASAKENLKSPLHQGRIYGEGWGMIFSKAALKGLPSPFNAAGWRCS